MVVLNDIIKVARFHITESRGIMSEMRQGVTEIFLDIYEPIPRRAQESYPNCCCILNYSV